MCVYIYVYMYLTVLCNVCLYVSLSLSLSFSLCLGVRFQFRGPCAITAIRYPTLKICVRLSTPKAEEGILCAS